MRYTAPLQDIRFVPEALAGLDQIGRKTLRDGGATALAIASEIVKTEQQLTQKITPNAQEVAQHLRAARSAFEDVVRWVSSQVKSQPNAVFAGSVPYLKLAGMLMGGWQMARALLAAEQRLASGDRNFDAKFLQNKVATTRYFAAHHLVQVPTLAQTILHDAESVISFNGEFF